MNPIEQFQPNVLVLNQDGRWTKEGELVRLLGRAMGVNVLVAQSIEEKAGIPVVVLGACADSVRDLGAKMGEVLGLIPGEHPFVSHQQVRFGGECVPAVLRQRQISEQNVHVCSHVPTKMGEYVVAETVSGPIWIQGSVGDSHYQIALGALDAMSGVQSIRELMRPANLGIISPLVGLLGDVKRRAGWRSPGLRASFMFDDPNLHTMAYGYLRFSELVDHAAKHNYHVSLATVPADSWYVHRGAAELVRSRGEAISLLMHGNTHVHKELAQDGTDNARLARLSQALARIEKCESASGLEIARVMAPPHGACSEESLACMRRLGFEGACISTGSLAHYNPLASWRDEVGARPAEFVCGFPVVPRFRLSKTCQNQILLAVLLDQPLIMVGHHGDVANGLDLLAELADFVNGLGPVRWMNMTRICRSNYRALQQGRSLAIEAYSNRIDLQLRSKVDELNVWRPGEANPQKVQIHREGRDMGLAGGWTDGEPLLQPDEPYELSVRNDNALDFRQIQLPPMRPWPVLRRALVEIRDRMRPIADVVLSGRG